MITQEDIDAMCDPWTQTKQQAEKHNYPPDQATYAHVECLSCGAGYFGPKRARHCYACEMRLTAPVPELPDKCTCVYSTAKNSKAVRDGYALSGGLVKRCAVCEARLKAAAKFVSPEPPPTPYERELLTILIEECAEVAQRATKMLRFGVNEVQPGQELTNRARLSDEAGDLFAMLERCLGDDLLEGERVRNARKKKNRNLKKYMQTTKETEE
jgi:hypothetical protein